jgi:hypothetical protein
MREVRGRWQGYRARRAARRMPPAMPPAPAPPSRVDELERLIAHHDRGDLTDEEFAAEKANLVSGNSG